MKLPLYIVHEGTLGELFKDEEGNFWTLGALSELYGNRVYKDTGTKTLCFNTHALTSPIKATFVSGIGYVGVLQADAEDGIRNYIHCHVSQENRSDEPIPVEYGYVFIPAQRKFYKNQAVQHKIARYSY